MQRFRPALSLACGMAAVGGGCSSSVDSIPSSGTGSPTSQVTFYEDAAPILYQHCVACHTAGGIAPFSLVEYQGAAKVAGAIKQQTSARTMPPWHADDSGTCNTYRDARWLTDAEIATLGAWVDGGAAEGNPANAPALPPATPGLDVVSTTLDMGATYTPDASLSDDYRCFVVDPGFATDQYLTGYEVKPGEPRVVHHVILFSLDSDASATAAEQLDAADPGPGYTCFGGAGVDANFTAGWAPGTPPTTFPDGTGVLLPGGRKLIIQVHYNLTQGALPDRTTIDLRLAPSVTKPAQFILMADTALSLPPGQTNATADMSLPVTDPLTVYGTYPHMHQLGKTLRVDDSGTAGSKCMVDVPDWNFHWQQLYLYEKPIQAAAGDHFDMHCTYDTTGKTSTVTWGEGTADEMCVNFFYVTHDNVGGCVSCGAVINGSGDPANLCPASATAFQALVDCVCTTGCSTECADTCGGAAVSSTCQSCIESKCTSQLTACLSSG